MPESIHTTESKNTKLASFCLLDCSLDMNLIIFCSFAYKFVMLLFLV
ncbi:hypothetical protein LINPERPRIM_LOCUS19175, partial [Linum perenne]